MALPPLLKNLFRLALRITRFPFDGPRPENVQMQGEGYNLELRKFKGCKLHHIEGYDSEKHCPVHVHNSMIKRRYDGVVSQPETA